MTALENESGPLLLDRRFLIGAVVAFLAAIALGYSTSTLILIIKGALLAIFILLVHLAFRATPPTFVGRFARAALAISLGVIFFVWALGYRFLPVGSDIDIWMQLVAGAVALIAYSLIWKSKA